MNEIETEIDKLAELLAKYILDREQAAKRAVAKECAEMITKHCDDSEGIGSCQLRDAMLHLYDQEPSEAPDMVAINDWIVRNHADVMPLGHVLHSFTRDFWPRRTSDESCENCKEAQAALEVVRWLRNNPYELCVEGGGAPRLYPMLPNGQVLFADSITELAAKLKEGK